MPNYQALSRTVHRNIRVASPRSLHFASHTLMAQIYAAELPLAIKWFPIVFSKYGEKLVLSGLFGLAPGENRFVTVDGHWHGDYVPAYFRRGPFAAALEERDASAIAIALDMEHEQVGTEQGEALFDLQGEPTPYLQAVIGFVDAMEASRRLTEDAVLALAQADLLVPWDIEVSEPGQEILPGLYRVDEEKLNQLPDEAFLALRKAGALPVIYAHLLSLTNLENLQSLGKPIPMANVSGISLV